MLTSLAPLQLYKSLFLVRLLTSVEAVALCLATFNRPITLCSLCTRAFAYLFGPKLGSWSFRQCPICRTHRLLHESWRLYTTWPAHSINRLTPVLHVEQGVSDLGSSACTQAGWEHRKSCFTFAFRAIFFGLWYTLGAISTPPLHLYHEWQPTIVPASYRCSPTGQELGG